MADVGGLVPQAAAPTVATLANTMATEAKSGDDVTRVGGFAPLIVVMGVSGSGKTTVGSALAARWHIPFLDGDLLHTPDSVQKMREGVALDDVDRIPWLEAVGNALAAAASSGIVVACSALKRSYRDMIRRAAPVYFVQLNGDRDLLRRRMTSRDSHFMPVSLLDSQLKTLEQLHDDEPGVRVEVSPSLDVLVNQIAMCVEGAGSANPPVPW